MGANPALSWLAVIGYSCASALPGIIIGWCIGPQIRELYPEKTFCTTDFGLDRYGRIMQLVMAIVSGFYMFIFIVAELTSISAIFATLTNNLAGTYTVVIRKNACRAESSPVNLALNPAPCGGTNGVVSGSVNQACESAPSALLNLTGYVGTIIR